MYCDTVWKETVNHRRLLFWTEVLVVFCFQSFFESHHAPAAERTVQQCCENILLNATWLKRDADDIHQYLLQRKAPPVWPLNSDPSLTCSLTPKWASSGYLQRKQKRLQNCNSIIRITQESIKRSDQETRTLFTLECDIVPHSASGRRKSTRAELWTQEMIHVILLWAGNACTHVVPSVWRSSHTVVLLRNHLYFLTFTDRKKKSMTLICSVLNLCFLLFCTNDDLLLFY